MNPNPSIGTPFGPAAVPPPLDDGPPWQRPEVAAPVAPVRARATRRQVAALIAAVALVTATSTAAVARYTGWGQRTVVERVVTNSNPIADRPADIQAILARVLPSVVSVSAVTDNSASSFDFDADTTRLTTRGTGIVVGAGEIVTNDHVVAGSTTITVAANGSSERHPATVIGAIPGEDLALLRVPGLKDLPPVGFGDSSKVAVGDEVITIGYALGLSGGPTVTDGIVSGTGRRVNTQTASGDITLEDMLQTDAAISSGNSGGPLVNGDSQVIGINTVIAMSTQETSATNIGFAITSAKVLRELPLLRAGQGAGSLESLNRVSVPACSRPTLGVEFVFTGAACRWQGRVS